MAAEGRNQTSLSRSFGCIDKLEDLLANGRCADGKVSRANREESESPARAELQLDENVTRLNRVDTNVDGSPGLTTSYVAQPFRAAEEGGVEACACDVPRQA
jgi:hypothetical protein